MGSNRKFSSLLSVQLIICPFHGMPFLLVLLQQELNSKLQSWKTKQQEVVSKLSIFRNDERKKSQDIQKYVANHQLDAYKNVSTCDWFSLAGSVVSSIIIITLLKLLKKAFQLNLQCEIFKT